MQRLIGGLQNYAWGSTSLLAAMRGDEPTGEPEAEIWYGAHPGVATMFEDGSTLLDVIEADPVGLVGHSIVDRFGPKLPFLLKLLAAGSPLSIQAHPSAEQARAGFAAEEAAGVPRDSFDRSFRDDNHKPELICALTSFDALVGFRHPDSTQEFWRAVGFDALLSPLAEGPKHVVEGLLNPEVWGATSDDITGFVADLVACCRSYDGEQWEREAALIVGLNEKYPLDPGIGVASLLNYVTLEPGEGLYLGAGHMHAYLGGLGIEIMANSDNVLRGGLTPKHIDVPNLLDVVLPEVHPANPIAAEPDGRYVTPAPEFELRRLDSSKLQEVSGPSIVLCTEGEAVVEAGSDALVLLPTEACWLGVDERATVSANAAVSQNECAVWLASVGSVSTLTGG